MLKGLENIEKYIHQDANVLGAFLFGSYARNKATSTSDIDICIVMNPIRIAPLELSQAKMRYLQLFPAIDIQIFQQLPIYIRIRILKEGSILVCKDEDALYNLALKVITEYSDYEHIFKEYIAEVYHGR